MTKASKVETPACREARTTIAIMAAILKGGSPRETDGWALDTAQKLYDQAVARVKVRHLNAGGGGRGSYPAAEIKPRS